eukprot:COSAG06_NODE_32003_length_512_cov_9.920097_1_plen_71_part_01
MKEMKKVEEKRPFCAILYIKMIILPRQARYKHTETSKKDRFVAGDEARQGHQEAAQGGQEGGLVYLFVGGT